jgi:hypothetical protein
MFRCPGLPGFPRVRSADFTSKFSDASHSLSRPRLSTASRKMTEVVAEATPQTAANHGMPPGRVRHMFKTLDTDGNGTLSLEELKMGFKKDFKVDALAPHVRAAVGSNQPTRGTAPQTPSACRPLAQIMSHRVHPFRRRRWWPAWRRCSSSTPTRRTERRRPSPSPHVAITPWAALA